ncbi:MAG: hypothetical protein ACOYMY_08210 [Prochlorococcaceae cyanobacterium]|jgi:hypothetical protein
MRRWSLHPLSCLTALLVAAPGLLPAIASASPMLEKVRTDKQLAQQLCGEFRKLNESGIRAHSPQGFSLTASRQNLSSLDAEILTTYVVGMYCSDVR